MTKLKLKLALDMAPGSRMHFLRQVLRLVGPYWNCETCGKVRGATLFLLLLTTAQVVITVWSNYWQRSLYDALEQRTVRGLLIQVAVFAAIFITSIVVTAAHLLVKRWLQINWRAWLTERLLGDWMAESRHYRLHFSAKEYDNPDQRIAEDIRIATESAIGLGHTLIFSFMTLGLFIDILWSVSGAIVVPGTTIQVPGYLVPLAFLYAGFGSVFGWLVGRPLVRTTNTLQTAEATFRFGLSRARENSEAIALIRGEARERTTSSARFKDILREWDLQSLAFMGLVSFSTGYGTLLPVFPILVAAPQYIAGAMSLGVLMQAAQAFERLTSSLSWPVNNVGEIARCRASADRVLDLYEAMQKLDAETQKPRHPRIAVDRSGQARLIVEDLCVAEPTGRILLENFSVSIRRGERILITGDPAVTGGLFKVIGGLWSWGSGRVRLPADSDMFFISQSPFLPEGTLREALSYPNPPDGYSENAMRNALKSAYLARLIPRLDEQDNWEQSLPQRTQQQLGFARILILRPAWIFLEEATDAFDPKNERLIFEMLRRELPNSSLLNISFHSGLRSLHHRTLVLSREPEVKVLFGGKRGNGATH